MIYFCLAFAEKWMLRQVTSSQNSVLFCKPSSVNFFSSVKFLGNWIPPGKFSFFNAEGVTGGIRALASLAAEESRNHRILALPHVPRGGTSPRTSMPGPSMFDPFRPAHTGSTAALRACKGLDLCFLSPFLFVKLEACQYRASVLASKAVQIF